MHLIERKKHEQSGLLLHFHEKKNKEKLDVDIVSSMHRKMTTSLNVDVLGEIIRTNSFEH